MTELVASVFLEQIKEPKNEQSHCMERFAASQNFTLTFSEHIYTLSFCLTGFPLFLTCPLCKTSGNHRSKMLLARCSSCGQNNCAKVMNACNTTCNKKVRVVAKARLHETSENRQNPSKVVRGLAIFMNELMSIPPTMLLTFRN